MRVLHLDEQREWRGGEQQASWLIQGLATRGHACLLAGKAGSAFLAAEHGGAAVERIVLPLLGEFDLWSAYRLGGIVRREQIDILHAHTSHAHQIACMARRFAGRGRVVVSRRVSFAPARNPINHWKYRQPDMFISVSHRVDQVLRDMGVSASRRAVVHSCVDPARLADPPLPRQQLDVGEAQLLLVSAGALVGHKDHDNLIRAMSVVVRAFPDARLLIAGEGELRPALESLIDTLGLRACVRLLGHRNDVPRIIKAADLYVSSSWSEGLGTSILEALASGVPVVATMAGGADEMVVPGDTGYLVPCRDAEALADAIVLSLRHREHAREMARAGRELVLTKFGVERMVEETLRIYEGLIVP